MGACDTAAPAPPGGFVWPLEGALTDSWGYDCRTDRGHRGIDITAAAGSPVNAAAAGVVSFVGYTPAEGGGQTITIDHAGGLRSTYLHVSEPSVIVGQSLSAGDPIGISGDGRLHFGIKIPNGGQDTYFNPLDLLPPMPATPSTTPPGDQTAPTPGDAVSEPVSTAPTPDPGMAVPIHQPNPVPAAPSAELPGTVAATVTAPHPALTPAADNTVASGVPAASGATTMIVAGSAFPETLPSPLLEGAAPLDAPLPVPGVFDDLFPDEMESDEAAPASRRLLNTHRSANRAIAAAAVLLASALAGAGIRLSKTSAKGSEPLPAAL